MWLKKKLAKLGGKEGNGPGRHLSEGVKYLQGR